MIHKSERFPENPVVATGFILKDLQFDMIHNFIRPEFDGP